MANPSLQEQAYLEATGFSTDTAAPWNPDFGTATFAMPPAEQVIYDNQGLFKAGMIWQHQLLTYYPPTRETRDISRFVQQITYTEAEGQAGVQGTIDFVDLDNPGGLADWQDEGSLRNWLARPGLVMIFSTAWQGHALQERQRWIAWEPTVGAPQDDSIDFYDYLVYLANAEASFGYTKQDASHPGGWTAHQITADICTRYSIPVKSLVSTTYKIPYFLYTGTIYEAIALAYSYDTAMTGNYYYITTEQGQLVVRRARSIIHGVNMPFLLDPSVNVRNPLTFTRSLDDFAMGIIPTGVDSAGNPAYIVSGNVDPNSTVTPEQGSADAALAGITQQAAATAADTMGSLTQQQKNDQLAAGVLFGTLQVNVKLGQVRDPTYTANAAQLLSNQLARAEKTLSVLADGNVLLREGDPCHVLGYPLDLYIQSITQTITREDHTMQLTLVWRQWEVADMEDYQTIQQAGAQYAEAQAEQAALQSQISGGSGGSGQSAPSSGTVIGLVTWQDLNTIGAKYGWSGQEINDWASVIKEESNGTLTDTNPSSGAYGIAQGITGPNWYYQFPGGNPNTVTGQLTAMAAYISQRYGNPTAAQQFHLANGWY
jgi:hypothetical protein